MKKVELWLVLGVISLWVGESWALSDEGIAAIRVVDFLDSIGVCTHIGQGIDNPAKVGDAIAYAGIRTLRDDGSPRHVQDWIAVHAHTGVKVVLTRSGPDDRAIGSLIRMSKRP